MKWYSSKPSNGQALVIDEETGRNVAVAYDEKDAALIAVAPELLSAAKAVIDRWGDGDLAAVRELDIVIHNLENQ